MDKDKFKKVEKALYNYKTLDVIMNSIRIDIENYKNDITLKAIGYEEKTGPTNKINRSLEDEVIRRDREINRLNASLKLHEDLKVKIEAALKLLDDTEMNLVKLRYFNKSKYTLRAIGLKIGLCETDCSKMKNRIIKKIGDIIYP